MTAVVQQEHRTVDALAGGLVHLVEQNAGGFVIGDFQRGRLAVLDLNAVGRGIQQVAGRSFQLRHGVPAAFQFRKLDHTIIVRSVAANNLVVHLTHLKLNAGDALAAVLIALDEDKPTDGFVGKGKRLRVVGVDHHGLRGAVQYIAGDRCGFRYHIGIGSQPGENDFTGFIGVIESVGADLSLSVRDKLAGGSSDGKSHAFQCLAGHSVLLYNDERAFRRVAELQRHRLARFDGGRLRRIVQYIAALGAGFFYHQRCAGVDIADCEAACAVRHEFAVGVAHHRSVRSGHKKFYIGERRVCRAVDLLDEQAALGAVAEIELHHILLLAADIRRLRCGVDHMAAVTGKLLDDVSTFFQPRHGKAAIGGSLVGADDCAARPAGAAEVFHLKYGVAHRFAGDGIILPHHQRRQWDILKGQHFGSAGLDIDLLGGFFDGIARGRLLLRYLVPAVPQTGELELTVLAGVVDAEVVDLAAAGIVAGVGNMEFRTLQGISRHAVHLFNGQRGLLMVFKIHGVVAVGVEGGKLRVRVQQIRGRHGLFRDFVHAGE